MDFQKLLQGVDCACGKHHSCDIDFVAIEHGAIRHLTGLCEDYKKILLVADENTYAAAGAATMEALAGKAVTKVIFPGSTILIPNEAAIERVQEDLPGHDLIVGIGSGVIQDLCKYVAFFGKLPYYIVATAPSMDGYASTGAAMITGGMKVTYSAKVPSAILAATEVLKDAPFDMLQAGYGDIVGKYSSLNDWKLSHIVNGEYFCDYIYDTTYQAVLDTLPRAKSILARDEESIRILMEALVGVGIMISLAGSSRPASGSEHHLSHFFEITGIVENKPYFPHGIDVAYSTVITAKIREELVAKTFPETQYRPKKAALAAKLDSIYGPVASGCMALQEKVGNYAANRADVYKANERAIKKVLAEMPGADTIEAILQDIGLDMQSFYDMYGEAKISDAIWYAKDLKDRYTVLWLNYDLFGGSV